MSSLEGTGKMMSLGAIAKSGTKPSNWILNNLMRRPSLPFILLNAAILGAGLYFFADWLVDALSLKTDQGQPSALAPTALLLSLFGGCIGARLTGFFVTGNDNLDPCTALIGLALLPSGIVCFTLATLPIAAIIAAAILPVAGFVWAMQRMGLGMAAWVGLGSLLLALAAWNCVRPKASSVKSDEWTGEE